MTFASTSIATSTSTACIVHRRSGERSGAGTGSAVTIASCADSSATWPLTTEAGLRSAELSSWAPVSPDAMAGSLTRVSRSKCGQPAWTHRTRMAVRTEQSERFRRYSSSPPKPPVLRPSSPPPLAVIPVLAGVALLSIVEPCASHVPNTPVLPSSRCGGSDAFPSAVPSQDLALTGRASREGSPSAGSGTCRRSFRLPRERRRNRVAR